MSYKKYLFIYIKEKNLWMAFQNGSPWGTIPNKK